MCNPLICFPIRYHVKSRLVWLILCEKKIDWNTDSVFRKGLYLSYLHLLYLSFSNDSYIMSKRHETTQSYSLILLNIFTKHSTNIFLFRNNVNQAPLKLLYIIIWNYIISWVKSSHKCLETFIFHYGQSSLPGLLGNLLQKIQGKPIDRATLHCMLNLI